MYLQATLQLAEMARLGVQPDSISATALVHACASNNKMDMALSVFDELFGASLPSRATAAADLERGRAFALRWHIEGFTFAPALHAWCLGTA